MHHLIFPSAFPLIFPLSVIALMLS